MKSSAKETGHGPEKEAGGADGGREVLEGDWTEGWPGEGEGAQLDRAEVSGRSRRSVAVERAHRRSAQTAHGQGAREEEKVMNVMFR